jgi:hypothetical protein
MSTKYDSELWGLGCGTDRGYVHVEYLPGKRVLVTSHDFKAHEHDQLKTTATTIDTVEDKFALNLGRKLMKHMKGE